MRKAGQSTQKQYLIRNSHKRRIQEYFILCLYSFFMSILCQFLIAYIICIRYQTSITIGKIS